MSPEKNRIPAGGIGVINTGVIATKLPPGA